MTKVPIFHFMLLVLSSITVDVADSQRTSASCESLGGSCIRRRSCTGTIDENIVGCSRQRVCCVKAQVSTPRETEPEPEPEPEPSISENDQCGLITILPPRESDPRLRIVGGDPAIEGEWPWQVSFRDGSGHFCGGTLISDQWIISAAHCFTRKSLPDVTVLLGEHNQQLTSGFEVSVKIESWILHPQYSTQGGYPNDIALVKLTNKVDITGNYVRAACLPTLSDVFDQTDYCYISGWGYTVGTADNNYLQHLNVEITSRQPCNESWNGVITNTQICIGNGDTGACRGDSGGPLVCLRDGQYTVAGATSWGSITCNDSGFPNVYTRIVSYLPWIWDQISA